MKTKAKKPAASKKAAPKPKLAKMSAKPRATKAAVITPEPKPAPAKEEVKISAANGRPMLKWVADIPERKTDCVQGHYELPALGAKKGDTIVAVKVTDMLGEEVVVMKEV